MTTKTIQFSNNSQLLIHQFPLIHQSPANLSSTSSWIKKRLPPVNQDLMTSEPPQEEPALTPNRPNITTRNSFLRFTVGVAEVLREMQFEIEMLASNQFSPSSSQSLKSSKRTLSGEQCIRLSSILVFSMQRFLCFLLMFSPWSNSTLLSLAWCNVLFGRIKPFTTGKYLAIWFLYDKKEKTY